MMASSSQTTTIDDNSVLVIKLKGQIVDHSTEDDNPLALLIADEAGTQGLDNLVEAIKRAKQNDEIKGIYIEAGQIYADPATVTALRDALKDFKTSKKFIVAYADQYSQGSYYISSVADKVWINPQGMLALHGMASQKQYMRDFLAKIGIKMQVVKVGQYKSATETYTEDHMSDANREQVTAYVNGIWNHMLKGIAESRKISVDSLNAYADRVMDLASTETLKKNKLIDGTLYTDQIKGEVKKLLKIDDDDDISQVSVMQMLQAKNESSSSDNQIAIYFCEGSIVQEPIQGYAMGGSSTIVGNTVCKDLEKLASSIVDTLSGEFYTHCVIGIGTPVTGIKDLARSFKEAQVALEVGKVFDTERSIVSYDKLGIARLIYQLPTTLCDMFLKEVFKRGSIESLDQETLFTIQRFFENNLNVSETSRKLFVHRNTLVYRLEKIKKLTGLDLREFEDAIIFKVALMVKKYLSSNPIKY